MTIATSTQGRSTVRLLAGTYNEHLTVAGGNPIVIAGPGATMLPAPDGVPALQLSAGANVHVRGIVFNEALSCSDASTQVVLRDVSFLSHQDSIVLDCHADFQRLYFEPQLSIGGATVVADRIRVKGIGVHDGLVLSGSTHLTVTVTNSIFSNIGPAATGTNAIEIAFSTVYGADGVAGAGSGFTFKNDIIVGTAQTNSANCPGCTFSNNVVFPQTVSLPGNITLDPRLVAPATGDFHLGDFSPATDAANDTTDHDYEGTHRPQGAAADIGALERP